MTTVKSGAGARIALARERELSGDWHGAIGDLLEVSDLDARSKAGTDALYLAAFIALQHHDSETARNLFYRLLPGRRWQHSDEERDRSACRPVSGLRVPRKISVGALRPRSSVTSS
jgi:hypothetical protein